jgi:hypothetical protein
MVNDTLLVSPQTEVASSDHLGTGDAKRGMVTTLGMTKVEMNA